MENLKRLCEMIVEKNGNPSCQDVLNCGYSTEYFIIMAQLILVQKSY